MTKSISVRQARERFSDVLGLVRDGKERVIVEKQGKPVAVIISPEQYDRFEHVARERLAQITEQLWRKNAEKDPEEVYREVTAAVEEVRQQPDEHERR